MKWFLIFWNKGKNRRKYLLSRRVILSWWETEGVRHVLLATFSILHLVRLPPPNAMFPLKQNVPNERHVAGGKGYANDHRFLKEKKMKRMRRDRLSLKAAVIMTSKFGPCMRRPGHVGAL